MCSQQDTGGEIKSILLKARLEQLSSLLVFIEQSLSSYNLPNSLIFDSKLAVEEVFVNLINHGYGTDNPGFIEITLMRKPNQLKILIEDEAPPFRPDDAPKPDLTEDLDTRIEGGLGLFLVYQLMDVVQYETVASRRNRLTLTKKINTLNEP